MTDLAPRIRALGPGVAPSSPELHHLPEGLQRVLCWSNGCELEANVLPAGEDVGVDRMLPLEELRFDGDGVRFALGPFDTQYVVSPRGHVEIVWGADDVDRGTDGRTPVARDPIALLSDLLVLQPDQTFDGCPTVDEVFGRDLDATPWPKAVELRGPAGPPVSEIHGKWLVYFESLPAWLRDVLRACNGATVSGVYLTAGLENQEFTQLFPVRRTGPEPSTEALSLREALLPQGLHERWFPVGATAANDLVLVEAPTGRVAVHPADHALDDESLVPLPDGGAAFVEALRRAAGRGGGRDE